MPTERPTERSGSSPTGWMVRRLLQVKPVPHRWRAAARLALSTAIPVLIGWLAGDIDAGLIASLGAFTCSYGSDRPFPNRGVQLAVIAVGFAVAVTVGAAATAAAWAAVTAVSAVAVLAVWLCSALSVGPPGAYMFVLVCAVGVGVSATGLPPWQIGLLVLGGGAIAWFVQMSAFLSAPRGPEKAALAAAGEAVATYLELAGTREAGAARRQAAAALSSAWAVLSEYQPKTAKRDRMLRRYRDANHALHVLFTDAMRAAASGAAVPSTEAATARAIGNQAADPGIVANRERNRPPLRAPAITTRLARTIKPGAHTRKVMLRVGVAAPLAGAVAALFGVGHVYWAMAAAVLILHQGADRVATLHRGADRLVGTFAGLGLAAMILSAHPQGLWLVAVVTVLQFVIELYVVSNYALATVFITAIALTIASGSRRADVAELVIDRGLDTAIGCAAGIAVYLLIARRQEGQRITVAIARVLNDTIRVTSLLASGDARSLAARGARRDLGDSVGELTAAGEAARNGFRRGRATEKRLAPVVTAAEHLGYATVAACWAAEHSPDETFGSADPQAYLAVLQGILGAVGSGAGLTITDQLPPFARPEVLALADALRKQ